MTTTNPLIDAAALPERFRHVNGYGAMTDASRGASIDSTTDEYAEIQSVANVGKTLEFVLPLVRSESAQLLLDVGCGVGTMVKTLLEQGYDAYGADLLGLERYWAQQNMPRDRFYLVDATRMALPFRDESIDFAFSLGVIEHVGTSDGHSDRLPDYREIRRRWLLEVLRVVRVGGCALIGGPNRAFPVDVAHGLDSRASMAERFLSRAAGGISVHKVWGENFLWGYTDVADYLKGQSCAVEPLSIGNYLGFSRVPPPLRAIAEKYVEWMPRYLLGTGFNPWMMALIRKTGSTE